MPSFQPWMSSRILDITGPGNGGGLSGNLRTSSFRNSLVDIWRWKGYPQDWTRVSRRESARMAMWGFLLLASRATNIAPSRGLKHVKHRITKNHHKKWNLRVSFFLVNVLGDFDVDCVVWLVR